MLRRLVFTSDGLDWKDLGGGVLRITANPLGAELPSPLTLRVHCSRAPRDGWATFYPDSRHGDSWRQVFPRPIQVRARINGATATFMLREPKLAPPSMLSVSLIGILRDEIESVDRQVGS